MKAHPIFTNKIIFAAAIVVLLVFVVLDANRYRQHKQINDEIKSMQEQSAQLQQQNKDLQGLVANWQSDASENTDKAAREQLNLQEPGEKVYSFAPQANTSQAVATAAATSAAASPDAATISNTHRWWNYFFNNN